jgi:hypothetical protein
MVKIIALRALWVIRSKDIPQPIQREPVGVELC